MLKSFLKYLLLINIIFSISGCAHLASEQKITNIEITSEALYLSGIDNYEKKHYKQAIENFESVRSIYPYSEFARQSMEQLIELYRIRNKYDEAILTSEELMYVYPHEAMENLRYQHAILYYERMNTQLRNQKLIAETAKVMLDFIEDFPHSNFIKDIEDKLSIINGRLVYREIEVGYFYEIQRNYVSALKRYLIAAQYSKTNTYRPEILYKIYYCYKMIGLENEGARYFNELNSNFSDSKWSKFALNLKNDR